MFKATEAMQRKNACRGGVGAKDGTSRAAKDVPSDKLILKKGPSYASVASIGNNRANAISENEPNYEPDCETDCEIRHDIKLPPDR
jgi:hypothetical protein